MKISGLFFKFRFLFQKKVIWEFYTLLIMFISFSKFLSVLSYSSLPTQLCIFFSFLKSIKSKLCSLIYGLQMKLTWPILEENGISLSQNQSVFNNSSSRDVTSHLPSFSTLEFFLVWAFMGLLLSQAVWVQLWSNPSVSGKQFYFYTHPPSLSLTSFLLSILQWSLILVKKSAVFMTQLVLNIYVSNSPQHDQW